MNKPAQLKAQEDSVAKLYEEMFRNDEDDDTNDDGAPAAVDDTPPPPPPPPPPQPQVQMVPALQYQELVQRYNTDISAMNTRVAQLEALLAKGANPEPPKAPLITDAERTEYGDSIDVMRKAARMEVQDELEGLRKQLEAAVQKLEQVGSVAPAVNELRQNAEEQKTQQYWVNLTHAVPDWQTVNNDQRFHNWLLETDPMTGLTRQAYLDDAFQQKDVGRTASIFNAWRNIFEQPKADKVDKTRQQLEAQITPGKAKTTNGGQKSEPAVFTRTDISAFYKDVALGLYRGKDSERARIEADIFLAQAEGRVREG